MDYLWQKELMFALLLEKDTWYRRSDEGNNLCLLLL